MYNDESNRSSQSPLTRRSIPSSKYTDNKSRPYQQQAQSPSSTYGVGYHNQQSNGTIRRRIDNNSSSVLTAGNRNRQSNPLDRVVKQNDIIVGQNYTIIKLLTEIRDRLPAPPHSEESTNCGQAANEPFTGAAQDNSAFEASDGQDAVSEEAAEVNYEAHEQQEEDNFNV